MPGWCLVTRPQGRGVLGSALPWGPLRFQPRGERMGSAVWVSTHDRPVPLSSLESPPPQQSMQRCRVTAEGQTLGALQLQS